MSELEKLNMEVLEGAKRVQEEQLAMHKRAEERAIKEHNLKIDLLHAELGKHKLPKHNKIIDPEALTAVEKFHNLFGHPVLLYSPSLPGEDRLKLRINLLQEELKELEHAFANRDMVGAADGLGDLLYVLAGTVLELGLKDRFKDIFNEIQRSNMSKACSSMEEAERTVLFYYNIGVEGYIEVKGDKFLVFRKSDNKVLKSVDYSPADLDKILAINCLK